MGDNAIALACGTAPKIKLPNELGKNPAEGSDSFLE